MTDTEIIDFHGGPAKLAQLLGVSQQRVCNWRTRGIPAFIKLQSPEIFLRDLLGKRPAKRKG